MLRLSSVTDDEYEPYTNGASPNTTFAQDIETIAADNLICTDIGNKMYSGWAEDFVTRVSDPSRAKIATKDNRNCLYYTANAGYKEENTKYLFKMNFKENTQYTLI